MAFRSDDQDYRWSPQDHRRGERQSGAGQDEDASTDSLSLHDTLRELAVTIAGFVGVIVLIVAVVRALHG